MKSLKQLLASTISLLGLITSANASFNADEWESVDYGYDNNGNVTELYDGDTGEIVGRYEYDPYGNTTKIEGKAAQENKIRFSTKEYDETSGLYYYGYRHYDPKSGRWPSRDPIEESGGVNLYGFVGNEPIGRWDKLGLLDAASRSASLDKENCILTISQQWQITWNGPWTRAQKDKWKQDAESRINESFGSAKIILIERLRGGGSVACPCDEIDITFDIEFDESFFSIDEDVEVTVNHEHGGSWVAGDGESALFDRMDVNEQTKGWNDDGSPIMQVPLAHEFGHLLGLAHPGAGLPGVEPNSIPEYDADIQSLMGRGAELREDHFGGIIGHLNNYCCKYEIQLP